MVLVIVIVNTSARWVCQSCSTCSGFSILNKRFNQSRSDERAFLDFTVRWASTTACSCGGRIIWEPCTIVGFPSGSELDDDWGIGHSSKAYP